MRSLLFVPGDSERKLEKGLASAADVLLIDLEDSVSVARKDAARDIASAFLRERRAAPRPRLFVRVNDFSTGLTDADLAAIMPARPDGIMLPKANSQADAVDLSARLRVAEAEAGLPDGSTPIIAIMTETAAGLLAASTWREPMPRMAGLTWGAEDLSADIGAVSPRNEAGVYTDVFRLARALTLLAAAASQTAPIDTVFVDFRDIEGLRRECQAAARDGFTAKMAIHPDQVAVINEVFTPAPEAVDAARALVRAFANAGDPGVVGIDGKMYDRPHLKRAERLLARAAALEQ
ncbi:MAG: CoA ester lyase [Rhizobiaceae bacterium]|nr:CoA ester lyase [Rhizobiaceae bacterium]MCV0406403.1 CoA ester lyase [Rhizobiaceae bacterium]